MTTLVAIDHKIRQLRRKNERSRPFLCNGSPIGCDVAEVGINPATDIPFWPHWNVRSGCDKQGWLRDCRQKYGRLSRTRNRIEELADSLAPLRLLELNLYPHFSPSLKDLAREHQETALFDYLMEITKPKVLLVHGNKPSTHLEKLFGFGVELPKDEFTSVTYKGETLEVYRSKRHFSRVSIDYVTSVASEIKAHIAKL